MKLVLSCEHGGNHVPARLRPRFRGAARALASHRGWDPGALQLARSLARASGAPLVACTTSRLVVDLNRSLHHPQLFSEWTRALPAVERDALIERWWRPYRDRVAALVEQGAAPGEPVLHLSVHSFTARWRSRAREVDVGLLYDPARARERAFASAYCAALGAREPELRLRRNQPYRGTADGLTTAFRERFPGSRYLGVELELSQRFPLGAASRWRRLRRSLVEALGVVLSR